MGRDWVDDSWSGSPSPEGSASHTLPGGNRPRAARRSEARWRFARSTTTLRKAVTDMKDAALPVKWRSERHRDNGSITATTNHRRPAIALPRNSSTHRPSRRLVPTTPTGHRHRPHRPTAPAAAEATTTVQAWAGVPTATATTATRPNLAARFAVADRCLRDATHPNSGAAFTVADFFDRRPFRPTAKTTTTTRVPTGIPTATATMTRRPRRPVVHSRTAGLRPSSRGGPLSA